MTRKGPDFDQPATATSLREAIRLARLQDAEQFDRSVDRRSAELARLEVLHAAVEPVFDEIPFEDDRFALALVPSAPARLWIDIVTYIVMDNQGGLYRMIRNEGSGRRVLVETDDVSVMAQRITDYVAREIVARERLSSGLGYERILTRRRRPNRAGLVVAAFVIGALAGVAALLATGWPQTWQINL